MIAATSYFSLESASLSRQHAGMATTVVDFECPSCKARCCAHSRRGEMVRCPHCFSFVTVPEPQTPQLKVPAPAQGEAPPLIVFQCTYCPTRIETDPANAGLACICPGCHADLTIPGNAQPIFPRRGHEPAPAGHRLNVAWLVAAALALTALAVGAAVFFLSSNSTSRPYP